jgi:5'-phosphate synthase pdxT subunit
MLSDQIEDGLPGQPTFGGLDVVVQRNAFGNQLDSFEVDIPFTGIEGSIHAAFIRAPLITSIGSKATVVSRLEDERVVGVVQERKLGISFHPEVTGEERVHKFFYEALVRA